MPHNSFHLHLSDLKQATHTAVQKLQLEQSLSEKSACKLVFNTHRIKHIELGFKCDSFQKFYQNYKNFKHQKALTKTNISIQSENFLHFENTDTYSDF